MKSLNEFISLVNIKGYPTKHFVPNIFYILSKNKIFQSPTLVKLILVKLKETINSLRKVNLTNFYYLCGKYTSITKFIKVQAY